jgi:hypothetical protein
MNSTRFRKIGYDLLLNLLCGPICRTILRRIRFYGVVIDHFPLEFVAIHRGQGLIQRLFMGLPDKSPISDFFHGTMYMTLGCSRSPVTVAVPKFSRSAAPGAFGAGAAFAAALGAADGPEAAAGVPLEAFAGVTGRAAARCGGTDGVSAGPRYWLGARRRRFAPSI